MANAGDNKPRFEGHVEKTNHEIMQDTSSVMIDEAMERQLCDTLPADIRMQTEASSSKEKVGIFVFATFTFFIVLNIFAFNIFVSNISFRRFNRFVNIASHIFIIS